jgi:formylglycine-generating enzyme required for sulfatase activity
MLTMPDSTTVGEKYIMPKTLNDFIAFLEDTPKEKLYAVHKDDSGYTYYDYENFEDFLEEFKKNDTSVLFHSVEAREIFDDLRKEYGIVWNHVDELTDQIQVRSLLFVALAEGYHHSGENSTWAQILENGLLLRILKRLQTLREEQGECPLPPETPEESAGSDPPAAVPSRPARCSSALPEVAFVNSLGMEFMRIPAGIFIMGTEKGDFAAACPDEFPAHPVSISQLFYLGRYPVTQEQWTALMKTNPSSTLWREPRVPVEGITWEQAQEFIRLLNAKEGRTSYRLPTEAEWEYAARAGTRTPWFFGRTADELAEYAWYAANSADGWHRTRTHPVGGKKPNPWGLHDMYGNVWEWVWDKYDSRWFGQSPPVDPQGPDTADGNISNSEGRVIEEFRVIRGGSYHNTARLCRSAYRQRRFSGSFYGQQPNVGCRLAVIL